MARGRMLNRAISRDRDVAGLANTVGLDAALLFTWMIPHLDRDGRLDADPEVIKGMVVPRIRHFDAGRVADLLRILAGTKLVDEYEDGRGGTFLVFPGFAKNQAGMRYDRESESEFPNPDECRIYSGSTPDVCRSTSGSTPAEWKGIEEKVKVSEGEEKDKSPSPDADDLCIPDRAPEKKPDILKSVIADTWQWYQRYHPRAKPGKKESALIAARLKEGSTPDDLKQAIDGYHKNPYHCGENDSGTKYQSASLIFRDASHVASGIEYATAQRQPPMSKLTRDNLAAGEAWLRMHEERDEDADER